MTGSTIPDRSRHAVRMLAGAIVVGLWAVQVTMPVRAEVMHAQVRAVSNGSGKLPGDAGWFDSTAAGQVAAEIGPLYGSGSGNGHQTATVSARSSFNALSLHPLTLKVYANSTSNISGVTKPAGEAMAIAGWSEDSVFISKTDATPKQYIDLEFSVEAILNANIVPYPGESYASFALLPDTPIHIPIMGDVVHRGTVYVTKASSTTFGGAVVKIVTTVGGGWDADKTFFDEEGVFHGTYLHRVYYNASRGGYPWSIAALAEVITKDSSATVDASHTVSLTAVLFEDGTTPESQEFEVSFASGMPSPNLVPEPPTSVLATLALAGLAMCVALKRRRALRSNQPAVVLSAVPITGQFFE
ncbi:MAG: hypothetical protein AB7U73_08160 [Pirellulales bacterium]